MLHTVRKHSEVDIKNWRRQRSLFTMVWGNLFSLLYFLWVDFDAAFFLNWYWFTALQLFLKLLKILSFYSISFGFFSLTQLGNFGRLLPSKFLKFKLKCHENILDHLVYKLLLPLKLIDDILLEINKLLFHLCHSFYCVICYARLFSCHIKGS